MENKQQTQNNDEAANNITNPPPPTTTPPQQGNNNGNPGQTLGIIGLVLAIIAIILAFIPCIGLYAIFPGSIALVLAIIAVAQANKVNASKGLGIAGIILASIAIIIAGIQYYYLSNVTDEFKKAAMDIEEFSDELESITNDMDNRNDDSDATNKNGDTETELQKLLDEKDYDKVIDIYEKSVGEYVDAYTRLQNGHMGASMKMMAAGTKISVIALKMVTISPFLSQEQEERFEAINEKYNNILNEQESTESEE